jgi:hypothetical protein
MRLRENTKRIVCVVRYEENISMLFGIAIASSLFGPGVWRG